MERFRSYNQIRSTIEINNKIIDFMGKHGCTPEEISTFKTATDKDIKESCREFYQYQRKYATDPLSVPIRNNSKKWRSVSDDDGETRTDFIIIPDRWEELWGTENEQEICDDIEDFIFSTVGYYSAYDFPTGKIITLRWHFKRVPCGVAIVHEAGIDW